MSLTEPRYTFGAMHVDTVDATGYTRLLLVDDDLGYGRFVATSEWIKFDEPLPGFTKEPPSKVPFRFLDRTTGIPY